ncbi:MAG: NAD(P)-dependent oxidoreductase [Candidatus Brevundimonas colombiensis]|uniref:NAD(P)-dependent oxidoreductase n=1 Tax=Candidatus Brevundimonas colombiensis TaxID=3121376 RepID=A0AAJ6BL64_9CAUL|nr:NAD(P)-dependent oxidoreductase [Brevundimonas sp.]WEK41178.1 MAG: NAD(P)-dependent oxidoreductase [Brevundimonas sp.]
MSIDILVIGLPALADDMLTRQAPDRGWTLHRPGPDGLPRPETAGRILAIAASGAVSVDARLIDTLPALKIISVHAVGYDLTDVAHARSRGVVVTHTPDVLNDDVADLALLLALGTLRRLPAMDAYVRAGRWASEGPPPLSRRAAGLRYGLLGLGRIGRAIAERLAPLAGEIAYHTRRPVADAPWRHVPDLVDLAAQVDVLVVIVPGGASTRGLVSSEVLKALGPDGVLVNVARGEVVDQDALVAALTSGALGGAGLDVFADEPNVPQALIDSDRCVLTPHVASATVQTREAMAELMIANLQAVLSDRPPISPVPD